MISRKEDFFGFEVLYDEKFYDAKLSFLEVRADAFIKMAVYGNRKTDHTSSISFRFPRGLAHIKNNEI